MLRNGLDRLKKVSLTNSSEYIRGSRVLDDISYITKAIEEEKYEMVEIWALKNTKFDDIMKFSIYEQAKQFAPKPDYSSVELFHTYLLFLCYYFMLSSILQNYLHQDKSKVSETEYDNLLVLYHFFYNRLKGDEFIIRCYNMYYLDIIQLCIAIPVTILGENLPSIQIFGEKL